MGRLAGRPDGMDRMVGRDSGDRRDDRDGIRSEKTCKIEFVQNGRTKKEALMQKASLVKK